MMIPKLAEFKSDWCIVPNMKRAGISGVVLLGLLAGCGGRTSSWSPSAVRTTNSLPVTLRVSQGVMDELRIHYVRPVYPADVQKQGDVTLWFLIDSNGTVRKVTALDGHPMLAAAAIEAVKQWKYTPYILNGEPVEVETRTVVSFGK
jgi:protein TonB